MKNMFVCAAFVVAAGMLGGCGQGTNSNAGSGAPQPAVHGANTAAGKNPKALVIDGYTPSFPYTLRSRIDKKQADGKVIHAANVEYSGLDAAAVADALKADLSKRGYTGESSPRQGGARLVFKNGQSRLLAVITPKQELQAGLKLRSSTANGIVYFAW